MPALFPGLGWGTKNTAKTLFRHLTLSSLKLSEARALHISNSQATELKGRVKGFVYCRSQSLLPSVMIFEPLERRDSLGSQ